jgi:hypothetical protein
MLRTNRPLDSRWLRPTLETLGTSLRIFLLNDDGSLEHLPLAKFERLRQGDLKEFLPQYAGKRVRYTLVVVEMENRRPVDIAMVRYSYLYFDSKGRIDPVERDKQATLAVNMVPPSPQEGQIGAVITAHHRFAKKHYERRYTWMPTPEIVESIAAAIFGRHPAVGWEEPRNQSTQ